MKTIDYWKECISQGADDCGLKLTSEQLHSLADAFALSTPPPTLAGTGTLNCPPPYVQPHQGTGTNTCTTPDGLQCYELKGVGLVVLAHEHNAQLATAKQEVEEARADALQAKAITLDFNDKMKYYKSSFERMSELFNEARQWASEQIKKENADEAVIADLRAKWDDVELVLANKNAELAAAEAKQDAYAKAAVGLALAQCDNEMNDLRSQLSALRARDNIGMSREEYHAAKKALEENDLLRAHLASEKQAKIERGDMVVELQDELARHRSHTVPLNAVAREIRDAITVLANRAFDLGVCSCGGAADEYARRHKEKEDAAESLLTALRMNTSHPNDQPGDRWMAPDYSKQKTGDGAETGSIDLLSLFDPEWAWRVTLEISKALDAPADLGTTPEIEGKKVRDIILLHARKAASVTHHRLRLLARCPTGTDLDTQIVKTQMELSAAKDSAKELWADFGDETDPRWSWVKEFIKQ